MVQNTVSSADNAGSGAPLVAAVPKNVGVSTAVETAAARYFPVVPVMPIANVEVASDAEAVRMPNANVAPEGSVPTTSVSDTV